MGVCHHHLLQFFTACGLKGCRYRSRMKDWKVTLRTHLSPHRLYSAMLVNIMELRSLPNFLATLHAGFSPCVTDDKDEGTYTPWVGYTEISIELTFT